MSKVIVFGNVNGQFSSALDKINSINKGKSGPFDFGIFLGDDLNLKINNDNNDNNNIDELVDEFKNDKFISDIPIYFFIGKNGILSKKLQEIADENNGEIGKNIFFFGESSVFTTSNGVKIVFFCDYGTLYNKDEIKSQIENFKKLASKPPQTDILITYDWPTNIHWKSNKQLPKLSNIGINSSKDVQLLAQELYPKYHFTTGCFWEREPYINNDIPNNPNCNESKVNSTSNFLDCDFSKITRFISLGYFGSTDRWHYAFKIPNVKNTDNNTPISDRVPGVTLCPYLPIRDNKRSYKNEYENENGNSLNNNCHYERFEKNKKRKQIRNFNVSPDDCFFCLSSPKLQKHLLISIGEESYIAAAKGPLTKPDPRHGLPCSGHVLIVPFAHAATKFDLNNLEPKASVEMERYKESIISLYKKLKHHTILFNLSKTDGVHMHTQVIPVSCSAIGAEKIFYVYRDEAKFANFRFEERAPRDDEKEYFYLKIVDGDAEKGNQVKYEILILLQNTRFDFQFGRRVLCKILNTSERTMWKNCLQSEEEECEDVRKFKEIFKEFDFTQEEEKESIETTEETNKASDDQ